MIQCRPPTVCKGADMRKIDRVQLVLNSVVNSDSGLLQIVVHLKHGDVDHLYFCTKEQPFINYSKINFLKYSREWLMLYGLETILREIDLYTFQKETVITAVAT